MNDEDFEDYHDNREFPRRVDEIDANELLQALTNLTLIGSDPYLRMQALNVAIIDKWLLDREADLINVMVDDERVGMDLKLFMNAQSQMWMFALYELLRTWRGRAKDVIKWTENGGLNTKIEHLRSKKGLESDPHHAYADQLAHIRDNRAIVDKIKDDLARTHVALTQLDFLRVAIAKHEVKNRNLLADAPGLATIDRWTGSMSYQLGAGRIILDTVTRRSFGDGLRHLNEDQSVPTAENLASFDEL